MFLHFKEYKDGNSECGLVYPSVKTWQAVFHKIAQSFLPANLSSNNVVSNLRITLSKSPLLNFINCEIRCNDVCKRKSCKFFLFSIFKNSSSWKQREINKCKLGLKQLRAYKKKS